MITQTEYKHRRDTLLAQMGKNSLAIIPTNLEYPRTQDIHYVFRPGSDFYYLTGFSEPEAILVLLSGTDKEKARCILFNRPRDIEREIWDGFRAGQEGAVLHYGMNEAYNIDTFEKELPNLLSSREAIFYPIGGEFALEGKITSALNLLRAKVRKGINTPRAFFDVAALTHQMRLIKSEAEIAVIQKAANINNEAHLRAMKACRAGMSERALAAELLYVYHQHDCLELAYHPIVATGDNACILHYYAGNRVLKEGELVLLDVGQEYEWYASDVTRTYPVNGKFSREQQMIYELVLHTQETILRMIKPGLAYHKMQETAIRTLTQGLVDLKLLKGSVDSLIEEKAYLDFYMHGAGHWMGLEVHDVGQYKKNDAWVPLEKGMVFTVEPGIYISPSNTKVDEKFRGIGVRIEDDVLVTDKGVHNFNAALPKKVAEIERVRT
jgi:Xaa-Pro aminopeptidase